MKTIFSAGPVQRIIRYDLKVLIKQVLKIMNNRIPEPTRANTYQENSHVLCDIRDEFFRHEKNKGREYIFRAIFNFFIVMYDFDQYYRDRIDWMFEKIIEAREDKTWHARRINRPREQHWKEDLE